jgi:hypothetical protein
LTDTTMIIHEESHTVETATGPMLVRVFKPRCGTENGEKQLGPFKPNAVAVVVHFSA